MFFYGGRAQIAFALEKNAVAGEKGSSSSSSCGSSTTTTPQPFYGPFSGITWVSQCQRRTSGLHGARED